MHRPVCLLAFLGLIGCVGEVPQDAGADSGMRLEAPLVGPRGLDDPRAAFAALGADARGLGVTLLDMHGTPGVRIPLSLSGADGLAVIGEDGLLVTARDGLHRVAPDGTAEPFGDVSFPWLYGVDVASDGRVVVAAESELVQLDPDGGVIDRTRTGSRFCWMDVVAPSSGSAVGVDLWGSSLHRPESGETETLDRVGIDLIAEIADGFVLGDRREGSVLRWSPDGGSGAAVALPDHVDGFEELVALAPTPDGAPRAFVQTVDGVVLVDLTDEPRPVGRLDGMLWLDVAAVPRPNVSQ